MALIVAVDTMQLAILAIIQMFSNALPAAHVWGRGGAPLRQCAGRGGHHSDWQLSPLPSCPCVFAPAVRTFAGPR